MAVNWSLLIYASRFGLYRARIAEINWEVPSTHWILYWGDLYSSIKWQYVGTHNELRAPSPTVSISRIAAPSQKISISSWGLHAIVLLFYSVPLAWSTSTCFFLSWSWSVCRMNWYWLQRVQMQDCESRWDVVWPNENRQLRKSRRVVTLN